MDLLLGLEAQDRLSAARRLERACSGWNAPRFFAVERRRRSHVPLEQTGEMTLVREPGLARDLRDRPGVARDLRCGPVQPQSATVLAHRDPVAGAEHAGQMRRVDADRIRELGEADGGADPRAEELLGR